MKTNYMRGHEAEKQVASYLKSKKYKILELNWKTKYCEIDIIAEHKKRMYFIEVKARSNVLHGQGYEYVTKKKLKQMKFAAEMWVANNNWTGEYQLSVASVDNGEIELINVDFSA